MDSIKDSISELLKQELNLGEIETERNVQARKTGFYLNIDVKNRYIFMITDDCMNNHKEKFILENIKITAIPLLRKNPNKGIIMKSDLSMTVQSMD